MQKYTLISLIYLRHPELAELAVMGIVYQKTKSTQDFWHQPQVWGFP